MEMPAPSTSEDSTTACAWFKNQFKSPYSARTVAFAALVGALCDIAVMIFAPNYNRDWAHGTLTAFIIFGGLKYIDYRDRLFLLDWANHFRSTSRTAASSDPELV